MDDEVENIMEQYQEILLQIEKSQLYNRHYIIIALIVASLISIGLLFMVLRKKIPAKAIPFVAIVLLCIVVALIFENHNLSSIRADLKEEKYVTYTGKMYVKYFNGSEDGTTILIPNGDQKKIKLTVSTAGARYLTASDEKIGAIIYSGDYYGSVVYASNSHYVVDIMIDRSVEMDE